jgi:cyanophycinase-like exopeptidase
MTRLLVIMGSGETAPTMVKPHRALFDRLGSGPAVVLDTPYGFQENAEDISHKAVGYFAASVGRTVEVASWRTAPPPGLVRERALAAIQAAAWVFAGPGSPTYALRQWQGSPIPELLRDKLFSGGAVVFASAAALTLGSHTIPVYEIYKAGFAPAWAEGLDLVRQATGLPAVVVPHYDNAEGGHHDTRFCYLGERRLAQMEAELPEEAFILGVDEHTGVILDLDARTATVIGNGGLTIRRHGQSTVYPTGSALTFADLADAHAPARSTVAAQAPSSTVEDGQPDSLAGEALRLEEVFTAAADAQDIDGCVAAILDLEQVLLDWSADTNTSPEGEQARATLRRMVVRLGRLASVGAGPFVEALLELRARARAGKDFATSDWIRDQLDAAGVEVRDTPEGARWLLR